MTRLGSPEALDQPLWTVTVEVFSPEPSLCGVWEEIAAAGRRPAGSPPAGLEGQPAGCYFDEGGGVRAWLALRVRAHEAAGARQRGENFVDDLLSRAPGEVARHRRLRVAVTVAPATERSWEKGKWLRAPRATDRMVRPVPWSHYELAADGRTLTVVWMSGQKQLERVDTVEGPDRVMVTLHERHPPLLTPSGALTISRPVRRARSVAVALKRPLGRREVCDGFDAAPRSTAGRSPHGGR
jgi:hypothetical protein